MDYRTLGKTGVVVSRYCLGAMMFGKMGNPDHEDSARIIHRALDAGINFVDTADVYGQDGLSERVVGRWLQKSGKRDDVVLATKFRFRMNEGPNGTGASRYRIVKTVEDSLRRLQTDHIDLYQIHMQDIDTPEEETLRALDDLIRAGKVLYIGASNYAAYRLMDSLHLADAMGTEKFVTLQAQYSLVCRDLEREHVPLCEHTGVGILPWSPLARGFLSGKYERGAEAPDGTRLAHGRWKKTLAAYDNERCWETIDAVRAVAAELESTPAEVSLAWLLHQPSVTSVIFGARTLGQLEANLGAAELELSEDQLERLDAASALDLGYPYDFLGRVQGAW